jgi:outer membrane protein OmpA-like peptidoglycan-associated protein
MQESAEQEIAAATGQQLEAARKMLAEERQVGAQRVSSVQEAANAQVDEAKRIAALAEARTGEALEEVARLEKVSKDARGQVITLPSGLLFKTGKSILNAGARPRLDEVASALKRIPDRKLLIEGHTDSVGKEATNLALSERRAQAVKDYLVWRGVPAERITTVGAGPSRPIADNSNTEGRAMNRRVEIVVETPSENTARADQ